MEGEDEVFQNPVRAEQVSLCCLMLIPLVADFLCHIPHISKKFRNPI